MFKYFSGTLYNIVKILNYIFSCMASGALLKILKRAAASQEFVFYLNTQLDTVGRFLINCQTFLE